MKYTFIRKPLSILLSILMVLSVFGGMAFSASAAAVTPKYKIVITSPSGKKATLVGSTALPYERTMDSFLSFVGAKKGTHYTSVYSVTHKSGAKITTLSKSKIVVNTYGEETIHIILNAVGGGRSQADYKLTVTALTKCVATATGYTGTYDGEAHTIAGVTPTSPESGAAVKYGTVSGTYNLADPPAFTDVGTHPVYYQVSAGGWVNLTGSVNVVINPKTVTVTADAKSKIRGESDPALTYTAEGLLGEDTVTGELTRAEGEAIGTYAIQQGTLAVGSNYAIAYTGANLTIEPNADDLAAANVDALINAIGEVAYTDECKTKIDEAKAAYDALTDAQKALVSNYETLQLAEGQYAALQLAADMTAFEAYKTAKKADMNALLQEGDSEAVQSIVGLAKTQIEGFTYDESKTLDENKAALDTLVANVPTAIATQRTAEALEAAKAEFATYKTTKKADVQALAQEGDSDATTQIITDAVTAIEALTYDESKTLDENKAAVDAAANIADALAAQRAADALAAAKRTAKSQLLSYKDSHDYRAEQKTELSNAIDNGIAAINAASNIAAVETALAAAKTAMDAIKTDAQLTAEELAAAKTAAKAELDAYKNADDYRTAEKEDLTNAIADAKAAIDGAADTAAVATALTNAKAAIDAIKTDAELTAEELAAAKADAKAELDAYKNADDYRTAEKEDLANAIADAKAAIDGAADIAAVDAAVEAAKAAMDAIKTDAQLTAEEEAAALAAAKNAAKAALDSYKSADDYRTAEKEALANAIAEAKAAIDAATDIAAVEAAVAAAQTAMDAIKTDAQLTAEELAAAKANAKAELDAYKNADDYRTAEKEDLANAIADAKAAIDGAADTAAVATALAAAKADIDKIKTDAQLTAKENQDAANAVIALIDAIGDVDATQESIDKVVAADEAFEALNDAQKALVTNAQTLTRAKNVLSFEMTKVATKAIIEDMRSDDDSAEMTQVMDDAIAAVDALQYDDAKTDEENSKTIEDGLYNAIHAVIAQQGVEALAAAKAELGVAVAEGRAFYETIKNNELYAQIADDLDTKLQQAEAVLTSDEATQREVEAVTEQAVNALAAAKEAKDAADEAAAFAAAQEKLRSNISEAKAFYETIKGESKYATIAEALNTEIEKAEAATASEDTAELLATAEAVTAAVATAKADKAAVDADPAYSTGNSSLYRIIKAIVDFLVDLVTRIIPSWFGK